VVWPSFLEPARGWARIVKRDVVALYFAARDPRVVWLAKAVAACAAAYALSPIDLIPDFIPILGYLDDAILVPLGILLAVRLAPSDVITRLRQEAESHLSRPTSRWGAIGVVAIWLIAAMLAAWWLATTTYVRQYPKIILWKPVYFPIKLCI